MIRQAGRLRRDRQSRRLLPGLCHRRPGAFVVVVRSADQFTEAIRRKLVLEIAGRAPRVIPAAAPGDVKRIDCLIGEKLRRQWMSE